MRTETNEIQIYSFNELSEEAQQKAIKEVVEQKRDYGNDYFFEFTLDHWKEKLSSLGFLDPEIQFSGFWSQGDGACFDCKQIDLNVLFAHLGAQGNKYAKKALRFDLPFYLFGSIDQNSFATHYCHERTRSFSFDGFHVRERCYRLERLVAALEEDIEILRYDLCNEIYRDLEREYDYQLSEEVIKEDIEANNYEFLADGSLYS